MQIPKFMMCAEMLLKNFVSFVFNFRLQTVSWICTVIWTAHIIIQIFLKRSIELLVVRMFSDGEKEKTNEPFC